MSKNIEKLQKYIEKQLQNKAGKIHPYLCSLEQFKKRGEENIYEEILSITENLSELSFVQRVSFIKAGIVEPPTCLQCGTPLKIKSRPTSAVFCSNRCGQKHESTREKIRQTNKDRYGIEEPLSLNRKKIKKKYGVDNPSQLDWVQQKKTNNSMKKHGVLFQQKHLGIKAVTKLENFDYLQKTPPLQIMEETGVSQSHLSKILRREGIADQFRSWGERDIYSFLESRGVVDIVTNSRSVVDGYELDFFLPECKVAIEYNGVFWHSKYSKNYHLKKTEKCEELGIQLIHIFDYEWLQEGTREIYKSIICSKLGLNKTVGARKCKLENISSSKYKTFCLENHAQGHVNSSVRYGLFHQKELIAVMGFAKPRFNQNFDWELTRYCSKKGVNVMGGAGKLLKRFVKNYDGSIVSYADRRRGVGNLYESLGFLKLGSSSPNYLWARHDKKLTRYQTQKHKLKKILKNYDPCISETQNMKNAGFVKVYDCGNLRFGLINTNTTTI
mgnify:CR=1 FL=1